MRSLAVAIAILLPALSHAAATGALDSAAADAADGVFPAGDEARAWSGSVSLLGYSVPDDQDFAQPRIVADRGRIHLEARYNYEELGTASGWLGYTFSAGQELKLDVTPMLGGVTGDLEGVAPGGLLTLDWLDLTLYSEAEYVFDLGNDSGDFFYLWSEASVAPAEWWRAGLVVQRTRVYQTGLDLQRFLLGASYHSIEIASYVFNLGWEDPTVVVSATAAF